MRYQLRIFSTKIDLKLGFLEAILCILCLLFTTLMNVSIITLITSKCLCMFGDSDDAPRGFAIDGRIAVDVAG